MKNNIKVEFDAVNNMNSMRLIFQFQETQNCFYNAIIFDNNDNIYRNVDVSSGHWFDLYFDNFFKYKIKLLSFDGNIVKIMYEKSFDINDHNFLISLQSTNKDDIDIWKNYLLLVESALNVKFKIIINGKIPINNKMDVVEISRYKYDLYLKHSNMPLTEDYSSLTIIKKLFYILDDESDIKIIDSEKSQILEKNKNVIFNLPYQVKIIEPLKIDPIIELPIYDIKNNIKNMINFSIVIIAKNEEQNLPKLLNTLDEFKNRDGEVCLLDVGSIDKTQKISSDWGCKVVVNTEFTKFVDIDIVKSINEKFNFDTYDIIRPDTKYFDLSDAKNYAGTISSNNMILVLDCSKYFINLNIDEIQNHINNEIDNLELNESISIYNREKYKWINIVNEVLIPNDNNNIKKINIYDSILRLEKFENKTDDNLIGLAIECFKDLNNEKFSQNFGIELMNHNFIQSAIREFHRHLGICNSNIDKAYTLVYIGDCLIKQDRINEGLELYNRSYLKCSTIRLALYKMGEHFFKKKMWDKCIFYLEGCLNIPNPNYYRDEPFHYKDGPYSMLYVAYWWIGDKKKGKLYFDKALEIDPYNSMYLSETRFHYEYEGNDIYGSLSFQDIQYLYKESKKYKSILEIGCDNGRSTHALLNGCNGMVTVITKNKLRQDFINNVGDYGNLRIMDMSSEQAKLELENRKFDMIFINCENDLEIRKDISIWEKYANHFICGDNYTNNKKSIDESFEISGVENDIWYKDISSFEKCIVYKRKEINNV